MSARRALLTLAALAAVAACDRMVANLAGGIGPEAGLLRGKQPSAASGVTHPQRLTDGIAAEAGDPARTDLASLFGSDGFATWDLGADVPVRCALVDADGDDRYIVSLSADGQTFAPLWTAPRDEDSGQQLRAGRDLNGHGRYLRVAALDGRGAFAVSEISAWTDCPKTFPPLAMQKGQPVDAGLLLKIWACAFLGFGYALLYGPRRPDWFKLLGVVPAGLAISVAMQTVDAWPLPGRLILMLLGGAAWIAIAIAVRLGRARRTGRGDGMPPPTVE
ncbi:MAG TPA: hypothetical protein VHJ20_15015 [Polyangia bacterium]|nr:hypothetical protein [Polyangia bacterium]